MKKAWIKIWTMTAALAVMLSAGSAALADDMTGPERTETELTELRVEGLTASRLSRTEIRLDWRAVPEARAYTVMRRSPGAGTWEFRDTVPAGFFPAYVDELITPEPQQYIYRVEAVPSDEDRYVGAPGDAALISNILLCLDPGHYKGSSGACEDDGLVYEECTFVLEVGLQVRDLLRDRYGITCRMTRETKDIELFGHRNGESSVEDRGLYAEGCDLFVSLHTNANGAGTNKYPEWYQPLYMNKPMVILNTLACDDPVAVELANEVGARLAHENYALGIAENETFATMEAGNVVEWFDWKDDDPSTAGLVCRRTGSQGDYYGVLRGSNAVGVPGLIIEHAYHTVVEMRRLANTGVLGPIYARIDAECIAGAYGFADAGE